MPSCFYLYKMYVLLRISESSWLEESTYIRMYLERLAVAIKADRLEIYRDRPSNKDVC